MRNILAVDDNLSILEILQFVLEDYGYKVEILSDGHKLFDKIQEVHPDLILLDVMLGDMDGRELCKQIKLKNTTHNIPVILLSAAVEMDKFVGNNQYAPNAFISKPFDINVLLNTVENQLAA